jgi:hypothetical protein
MTETEMRQRLWWHIMTLDVQVAEDAGTDPLIWEGMWTVKLPSNLDDVELDATSELPLPPPAGEAFDPDTHMMQNSGYHDQPPTNHTHRTDMFFALMQVEMSYAMRRFAFSKHFCEANGYDYLVTSEVRVQFLEELMRKIDRKYLQYCNRNDMFSFFERNSAKLMLSRNLMVARKAGLAKDTLHNCVQVLEAAAAIRKTHKRWAWILRSYVELEAMALLWECIGRFWSDTEHVGFLDRSKINPEELKHAWTLGEIGFRRGKEDDMGRCYGDKWSRIEMLRGCGLEQRQSR